MSPVLTALIATVVAAGPVESVSAQEAVRGTAAVQVPDQAARYDSAGQREPAPSDPDFLFGTPRFTITVLGGVFLPRAEGQFYDFTFDELTLDRDSFVGAALGAEVGVRLSDHLDVALTLAGNRSQEESSDREWVEVTPGGEEEPIRQTTRLQAGPTLTGGLKVYPLGRGETLSRFVWVPSRVAPYLSAGVGASWYVLEQWGDFAVPVPEEEGVRRVVTEQYSSNGGGVATFAGVGAEITLRPRLALTLDGRYLWREAELRGDFTDDWEPIDLSGLSLSAGLSYRFH